MGEIREQEYDFSVLELLMALKEKAVAIAAVGLVCALLGYLGSAFLIPHKYEASIDMIVNTKTELTVGITNDNIASAQSLVDTYAIIIKSNKVLNQVIDDLKLGYSYQELYEKVHVDAINNTQVMKIAVQETDPELAKEIAETIALVAPDIIVDAVEAGSCKVISQVECSEDPVSPNVLFNTAVLCFLGLLVSVGVVVLKELLQDSIADEQDVQRKLGLPVLSVIPSVEEK